MHDCTLCYARAQFFTHACYGCVATGTRKPQPASTTRMRRTDALCPVFCVGVGVVVVDAFVIFRFYAEK
ncbi:MAG: hypothetical protein Ta2A_03790 [Treponemataceae bacterium]|nr:MAG: hypothetical protein Ta2A_03790 [Treponemataceae bacterium]